MNVILALFLLLPVVAMADPNGKAGFTSKMSTGCGSCHGGNAGAAVTVTLDGPRTIKPGQKVDYSIIVGHATARSAGVSITVRNAATATTGAVGTLSVAASGSGLRVRTPGSGQEITQSAPKSMSGGKTTFAFSWTAPSTPGTYYVQAVANAVNGDGNESDADDWTFLEPVEIKVEQATGVDEATEPTMMVYPNPLTSEQILHIDGDVTGPTNVEVIDATGAVVIREEMNIESGTLPRPLAELPRGTYMIVTTNAMASRRRMFVVY